MSAFVIQSDPDFGKSFRRTIGIEDYTSFILLPNRNVLPIPTDSAGNNGVFTNATTTVRVLLANEDVTTDWTVSLEQATNCTVSVSNITKIATVSAIAADTANFIIKAVKSGESNIYTTVTVYKAKAGTNGIDGADGTTSLLEVDVNHNVYNLNSSNTITTGTYNVILGNTLNASSFDNTIMLGRDSYAHVDGEYVLSNSTTYPKMHIFLLHRISSAGEAVVLTTDGAEPTTGNCPRIINGYFAGTVDVFCRDEAGEFRLKKAIIFNESSIIQDVTLTDFSYNNGITGTVTLTEDSNGLNVSVDLSGTSDLLITAIVEGISTHNYL